MKQRVLRGVFVLLFLTGSVSVSGCGAAFAADFAKSLSENPFRNEPSEAACRRGRTSEGDQSLAVARLREPECGERSWRAASLGAVETSFRIGSKLPVPEVETLPNGLKVAWFVSEKLPVVDMTMVFQSGYRDDPAGKSGTAELLTRSLFRGAAGMSAQQLANEIEKRGASRISMANEDHISLGLHGLAADAPALLDLLGKVTTRPDLTEAEVMREHGRILDSWRHLGDYSESLAELAYQRVIAEGTSYARGGFASAREFSSVKREDVSTFHRRHFVPTNAILLIVGRVKKEEFRGKVLQAFGAWKGNPPERSWKPVSDPRFRKLKGKIVLVDRPGLTQAQVRIGFRAPLIQAPEHHALVVANALLGAYFESRLNLVIRDQLGLTYSIGSSFSYSRDLADFRVVSSTRNETVGQLVDKAISILRELKNSSGPLPKTAASSSENAIDPQFRTEIQQAKEYLIGGFPLSSSTMEAVASRWVTGYLFNLGPDFLNEFIPKIHAVTPEQVLEAVAKDFDLDHLVIVVAGDRAAIEKSLNQARLKSFGSLTVQELM